MPEIHVRRIKFAFLLILGSAATGACSSGGVSEQAANPPPSLGGIWKGQMIAASGASLPTLMLVTEEGKFFTVAENTATGCADVAEGELTLAVDSFSGNANFGLISYTTDIGVQIDCAFADGSVGGTAGLTGTVVPRKTLSLSANDVTSLGTVLPGANGSLTFDALYDETSSLSKVSGNWTLSTGAVVSINSAGVIFSQDAVNGCVVNGKVSLIDSSYDAYAVSASYSNCGPNASVLNGLTGTGLMTLDDTQIPNVLYVVYSLTLPGGEELVIAVNATN
jgi:hypothetical protein